MSRARNRREALIKKFRVLGQERIDNLNHCLLRLEKDSTDGGTTEELLREIHTLKGESRLVNLSDITELSHRTEDLLIRARDAQFEHLDRQIDTIFAALDALRTLIADTLPPDQLQATKRNALALIDATMAGETPEVAPRTTGKASPAAVPPSEAFAESTATDTLAPQKDTNTVSTPQDAAAPAKPVQKPQRPSFAGIGASDVVRIDRHKLDQLTDMVTDLVIAQSQVGETLREISRVSHTLGKHARHIHSQLIQFDANLQQSSSAGATQAGPLNDQVAHLGTNVKKLNDLALLGRDSEFENRVRLEELEDRVREIRMMPISALLDRYPRAIRDLAREQQKRIRVDVGIENPEIDQFVLEQIGEPLLHLIRNSVDHGIESPADRQKAGKEPEAVLRLAASQVGSWVRVIVEDDGKGINPDAVGAAAVDKGLIQGSDLWDMTPEQVVDLVFTAGFSTRGTASELSGRGVGLDVVKHRIETLGGNVELTTTKGKGTRFTLTVPTSVVVTRAMVIKTDEQTFAVPVNEVSRALEVEAKDVQNAADGKAIHVFGELQPLRDLRSVLSISANGSHTEDASVLKVLLLAHHAGLIGLAVDSFLGERQVVQRPLDPFLEGLRLFAGTVLLEGGGLALTLNVPEVIRESVDRRGRGSFSRLGDMDASTRTVLVVDDSEMTRDLIVGVLHDLGYEVLEAVNGRDALGRLSQRRPDLVMTDLDMPELNGFQLVEQIRASSDLADLPIVVCSTRGSAEDKERAVGLGADGYIVKSEFSEHRLENLLERFLGVDGR